MLIKKFWKQNKFNIISKRVKFLSEKIELDEIEKNTLMVIETWIWWILL